MQQLLTLEEKFALITECRQSGQSDKQWMLQHGISGTTFYRWIKQLRKANQGIPARTIMPGQSEKQDVVRVDVIPGIQSIAQHEAEKAAMETTFEIEVAGVRLRVTNAANAKLLAETIWRLKESIC